MRGGCSCSEWALGKVQEGEKHRAARDSPGSRVSVILLCLYHGALFLLLH